MATLTLSVLRCPEAVIAEQRQVQGGELTIGRGPECGWPLPDPFRSLSRKHCVLEFQAGAWQVRDLSANGTFINFATVAIGRDMTQPLRDGDRLRLGAYEIEVRLEEVGPSLDAQFGEAPPAAHAYAPDRAAVPAFGGGFGSAAAGVPGLPGAGGRPSFASARLPGLDDPVDNPIGGYDHGQSSHHDQAQRNHTPAVQGAYIPPAAVSVGRQLIPDDWDWAAPGGGQPAAAASPFSSPAAPSLAPPFSPPSPFVAPRQPPPPPLAVQVSAAVVPAQALQAQSPPAVPAAVSADQQLPAGLAALAAGAELPPELLVIAAGDPQAALRNAGALLRIAVAGLRALLIARGSVKREFRIEQTMLRPSDNNPLKFAASDEQALAALLDPRKASLRAVQESIDDLTLHQVAALEATQAAARALLERMGPAAIEAEDSGGGLFPGAREKRLWEAYKRRHAKLLEQFDDDFDSAFGTAFARAYEQAAGRAKG